MMRTGNTTSKAPNTPNILWKDQVPQTDYTWGYCGSPAVAGGLVFQGGNRPDSIRALDATTGKEKWETNVNGRITSSPTVINDRVLFSTYGKSVYSLSVLDGSEVWRMPITNYADSSPTVSDGQVFVGDGTGDYVPPIPSFLYCFDENWGFMKWHYMTQGQIVSSPTIVNNMVIFGSYDGSVYALPTTDPNNDGLMDMTEIIWEFQAGSRIVASAAVFENTVYIGTLDGTLYALPLNDPDFNKMITKDEVKWKFKTNNEIWSSVGIANGRLFVGSHDYHLYALPLHDPNDDGLISNNEILWKYKTSHKIWSSPTIAGGKVFVTTQDYRIWAISEDEGKFIWNYTMPIQSVPYGSEYLYASPSIVDGRIYVGNYDNTIYCFGTDDLSPPGVESHLPVNNSINVSLNTDLEVTFNQSLTGQLITDSGVELKSSKGEIIDVEVEYDKDLRKLTINPITDLKPSERYSIRLKARYFQDDAGNTLDGNYNGIRELEPADDFIWYIETMEQVGRKPELGQISISPESGFIDTDFEIRVTYTDLDGDVPGPVTGGYIRVFFDDSSTGSDMSWANNSNIPDAWLLDRDHRNGELYRFNRTFSARGTHSFIIECSDGNNTDRSAAIMLPSVTNSPPGLSIPTQYVMEDEEYMLDLRDFVTDIDDPVESLTFQEGSEYLEIMDDHMLKCVFDRDGIGSHRVNISVSDGENTSIARVLFVIDPVNDPPSFRPGITALPPISVREDELSIFKLDPYITDPDTPEELLKVTTDSDYITVMGFTLYLKYPHPVTGEVVSISITDSLSVFDTNLDVTVIQINDPPVVSIPPVYAVEDITTRIMLGSYITDEESVPAGFTITVESRALGKIEVGFDLQLVLVYREGMLEDELNLTVIDGNVTVYSVVPVSVMPVNDPPGLIAPTVSEEGGKDIKMYRFSVWYSDAELSSASGVEPLVELVLDDEHYSMTMINQSVLDPTNRLYGITLGLTPGTHFYYFSCDDVSGEPNSHYQTDLKDLVVKSSTDEPDDGGITHADFDIDSIDDLRNAFWFVIFIVILIVLALINVMIAYQRSKQKRARIVQKPLVLGPDIGEPVEPDSPAPGPDGRDGGGPDGQPPGPDGDVTVPSHHIPTTSQPTSAVPPHSGTGERGGTPSNIPPSPLPRTKPLGPGSKDIPRLEDILKERGDGK